MNISKLYKLFLEFPKVCTDSRNTVEGSLFFALKGDNFNGNAFAEKALEKCAYAIVDEEVFCMDERYILVENALSTLQSLASYHRKRMGTPIIAITGTNGKTTTKELIAKVMSEKYKVVYTQGNLNNHIGVPITLLNITKDDEFCIVEMGANHVGEIEQLCKIAAPDFGIITNVGRAHLEGFGSIEGVKKGKGELYKYLYENNGLAFINDDSEILEDMNPPHDSVYYGTKSFTHCQGKILGSDLFLKFAWFATNGIAQDDDKLDWNKKNRVITTNLIGKYNFENALAAVCVGNNFGIEPEEVKKALENYIPNNNRSQLTRTKKNTLLLDAYNANPTSMKMAIENFIELKLPNKVIILGDMLELGSAAIREHGVIVGLVNDNSFDNIYLVGDIFYQFNDVDGVNVFKNISDLGKCFQQKPLENKSILIKGSRSMELEYITKYL